MKVATTFDRWILSFSHSLDWMNPFSPCPSSIISRERCRTFEENVSSNEFIYSKKSFHFVLKTAFVSNEGGRERSSQAAGWMSGKRQGEHFLLQWRLLKGQCVPLFTGVARSVIDYLFGWGFGVHLMVQERCTEGSVLSTWWSSLLGAALNQKLRQETNANCGVLCQCMRLCRDASHTANR